MDHCVSLTENDIPGALLKGQHPELLKEDELKSWLQCREAQGRLGEASETLC